MAYFFGDIQPVILLSFVAILVACPGLVAIWLLWRRDILKEQRERVVAIVGLISAAVGAGLAYLNASAADERIHRATEIATEALVTWQANFSFFLIDDWDLVVTQFKQELPLPDTIHFTLIGYDSAKKTHHVLGPFPYSSSRAERGFLDHIQFAKFKAIKAEACEKAQLETCDSLKVQSIVVDVEVPGGAKPFFVPAAKTTLGDLFASNARRER